MNSRSTLPFVARVAAAVLIAQATGAGFAWAQPTSGNLITNGDAEGGAGAPGSSQIASPPGWMVTGQFTAVQYGASGGFPDHTSPGPDDRGHNFFAGGNAPLSTATQTVSLAAYRGEIAGGKATFVLDGWLGGYEDQADSAKVTVVFKNQAGAKLSVATIGPVTPAQRETKTGLFHQSASGPVPAGATTATVTIVITRVTGNYNDGSVDDLSLTLK